MAADTGRCVTLSHIHMAQGAGGRSPVRFRRVGSGDPVTRITGLVGGTPGKIGSVTVLAVGKTSGPPRARIGSCKCTVICRATPWSRIDSSVPMAGNTMAQGSVETPGAPSDILSLRRSGRIGTIRVAYCTNGIIARIGVRMAETSGWSGAPPRSHRMRCIIQQTVTTEGVEA